MITVIEFDFEKKLERTIQVAEAKASYEQGRFCWIDISAEEGAPVETLLRDLGIGELAISEVLGPDREGRYDVYDECLHFAVTEALIVEGRLATAHVDVVLSSRAIVTFHRKDVEFLKQMKRTYREDFLKFAKTPGFLLYEIGDHLIEIYRKTLREVTGQVEQVQLKLFGEVSDEIFKHVSELTSDILLFRKIALATRELMHELASRKSAFITETTQPFIESMAGTLDRLGSDVSTERDVLSGTLGLYMGMVGHRTNKIVSRLTVISVIFLPLGFLVSLYGSNFHEIPGTASPWGFFVFCLICLAIALALLGVMKRKRWI